jgi:hypothetical protein
MGDNIVKCIQFHDYVKDGNVVEVMNCLEEDPSLLNILDGVSKYLIDN